MIAIKEAYNVSIKSCFFQADKEKLIVEREKELGNIKCYDAGMALFEPPCTNNVGQIYSCIGGGSLSDTPVNQGPGNRWLLYEIVVCC